MTRYPVCVLFVEFFLCDPFLFSSIVGLFELWVLFLVLLVDSGKGCCGCCCLMLVFVGTTVASHGCGCVFSFRLIEKFLERQCFMGVVPDVGNMPSSDQFVRKAVLESQVSRLREALASFCSTSDSLGWNPLHILGFRRLQSTCTTLPMWTSPNWALSANRMSTPMPSGWHMCSAKIR